MKKDALKNSFETLLKNREYAEAEKLLVAYMEENPEDWDAKLLYGTCRMMQGDAETAKLVHQQAQGHFECGKDIPEEQKSFWDKYKKLIFYGAIGTALVLAGGAYLGKQMQDVSGSLSMSMSAYAEQQQLPLVKVNTKYDGPAMPHMEAKRHDALFSKGQK